ncbi:MAG: diversity-generating retroelement protein Avd [Thiotrichales bacterium]|nr:diversity-generating retroelement protein Avd [Thiotrichales bacterium]
MSNLILREKFEAVLQSIYVAVRQFPKHEKFALAADIKRTAWKVFRLMTEFVRKTHKKTTLNHIDVELDVLRSQIRMAHEFKYLAFDRYRRLSESLSEVGRILGGLHKSTG